MARDETASRIAGEVRRLLRRAASTTGTAAPRGGAGTPREDGGAAVTRALEAYTRGEIIEAVRALARLSALHPQSHGVRNPAAASTLGALARRDSDHDARPEEFLLALLLLKEALD